MAVSAEGRTPARAAAPAGSRRRSHPRPGRLLGVLLATGLIAGPAAVALVRGKRRRRRSPTDRRSRAPGSSYAAVAINQWVAEVAVKNGDSVNYQTSSSVIGLNDFAQKQVDFGASEIGYSTGQAQYTPPAGYAYQYLPDVAGATCIDVQPQRHGRPDQDAAAQLLGDARDLHRAHQDVERPADPGPQSRGHCCRASRSPSCTARILRETTTSSRITCSSSQPGLERVRPPARLPSGRTPSGPSPRAGAKGKYNFSGWIGQSGSDNASNYVASRTGPSPTWRRPTPSSTTCPCAAVRTPVATGCSRPNTTTQSHSVRPAAARPRAEAQRGLLEHPAVRLPDLRLQLPDHAARSRPTPRRVPSRDSSSCSWPAQASSPPGALGYSPLPPNLVADDFKAVSRIAGAAPPPSAPTASNRPNPYVDGTTPLPGEKQNSGGGTTTTTTTPPLRPW